MNQETKLYKQITYNELVYNRALNNVSKHKPYKLFLLVSFIFVKSIISKLFSSGKSKDNKNKIIGITWSELHKTKITFVNKKIPILEINNYSYFKQTKYYQHISFVQIIKNALNVSDEFNSSFFYKLYVFMEYEMLKKATQNLNEIYIAGHLDRYACMLANLSQKNNFKINVVQHGSLLIIDEPLEPIPINGDLYYMYDFSLPIFKKLFTFSEVSNFYLQQINTNFKNNLKPYSKLLVSYGCQDSKVENNVTILKELINLSKKNKFDIQIIPHPRENDETYKHFTKSKNVFISKNKEYKPDLFVTRFSTLGLEFSSINIPVLFVNIDKVNLDFIVSGKYNVVNNVNEIESFYENIILINEK